jgi:anti-sigma-K factor RskA
MRIISISAAAAVLVLAGCASQNDGLVSTTAPTVVASSNTELTAQTKLVCHKETSTGSTMIHSVCETEQSEADRQALQNKLLNNGSQNAAGHQGIGH